MAFSKIQHARKADYTTRSSNSSYPHPTSLFPSAELLDESLTMYYLQNLPECRINVAKGLALLYELEESEEQIYQAVTLRRRNTQSSGGVFSGSPDLGFFKVQEECENEKRVIQNERTLLQNYLKYENQKIVILEGCIFSLPEPQRSVIVGRYIERLSWSSIQQKLKRSASRIFVLNREGIHGIHEAVKDLNRLSGRVQPLEMCENSN